MLKSAAVASSFSLDSPREENNIGAGKRVGVLFADSSRNYISKFMNDEWLQSNGFKVEERCASHRVVL